MFLVKKGFANRDISATKGKVIDIKDKKLASSLLEAGFISKYSEKDMSNNEMTKKIKELEEEVSSKDNEIQSLNDRIAQLEEELNSKSNDSSNNENDDENLIDSSSDNENNE